MIEGKIYCDVCGNVGYFETCYLPGGWEIIGENKHACPTCSDKWVTKEQVDECDPGQLIDFS